MLVACAVLKMWLTWKTVRTARAAIVVADATGEKNYRGNAKGALVAVTICGLMTAAVLYFGAKMVP